LSRKREQSVAGTAVAAGEKPLYGKIPAGMLVGDLASGTIVPGVGITDVIRVGEKMTEVCRRFNVPLQEMPAPAEEWTVDHYGIRKRVKKIPEIRQELFDQAVSVVFRGERYEQMTAVRIEIFRGKELPFKTYDGIGFAASCRKLFGTGEGGGRLDADEGRKIAGKIPGASFYTAEDGAYSFSFREAGIFYTFKDDSLFEIQIEYGTIGGGWQAKE